MKMVSLLLDSVYILYQAEKSHLYIKHSSNSLINSKFGFVIHLWMGYLRLAVSRDFFVEKPHINDASALEELKFLEIFYDVVK